MSNIDFKISEEIKNRAKDFGDSLEALDFNNFNRYLVLYISALEYFIEKEDPKVIDMVNKYVDFIAEKRFKSDITDAMAFCN